jgi:hypothetical protein
LGASPVRARVSFQLDPWGRLAGSIANPPVLYRYNARWSRVMVNLVGQDVRDCGRSPAPSDCETQNFVRFGLRHTGPAWTTDYDGRFRAFDVGIGRIEGGKALATSVRLSIPGSAWGTSSVDLLARTELAERPLAGFYDLDFEIGPEVALSRIQGVQLLHDTGYWVR